MQEPAVKKYRLPPEEIKKRYGACGEFAEAGDQEERHLKEDLYQYGTNAMQRMARGKKRRREP